MASGGGSAPKLFREAIQQGEVSALAQRVGAVESQRLAQVQDTAAQGRLEQPNAVQGRGTRERLVASALPRPTRLDRAQSFDHHAVVVAMRAEMEREPKAQDRAFLGGEQHAVAPEIVIADPLATERVEQGLKGGPLDGLPRQQMMTLEIGRMAGLTGPVNRRKREVAHV